MADKPMDEMSADSSLDGAERMLAEAADGKVITTAVMAAYAVDQLHEAAVITDIADANEIVVFQTDTEKIITAANFSGWMKNEIEEATVGTDIVGGDYVVYSDGGTLKRITLTNMLADIATITTSIAGLGTSIS